MILCNYPRSIKTTQTAPSPLCCSFLASVERNTISGASFRLTEAKKAGDRSRAEAPIPGRFLDSTDGKPAFDYTIKSGGEFVKAIGEGDKKYYRFAIAIMTPGTNEYRIALGTDKLNDTPFLEHHSGASEKAGYTAVFVVNNVSKEIKDISVLYSVSIKTKKEAVEEFTSSGLGQKPITLPASNITIADLLELVNESFPDILSLNHGVCPHGLC